MTNPESPAPVMLTNCVVVGQSGFPFEVGDSLNLYFDEREVSCRGSEQLAKFLMLELVSVSVSGPGSVTSGGGFIGGGFGFDGALQGMAVAGILNALTSSTKIHTFVTLTTNFGELHLHYSSMEPSVLRMSLADVFVKLRRQTPGWIQEREQLIDSHVDLGQLTVEEAGTLKNRLKSRPIWPNPRADAEAQRLIGEQTLEAGPKGTCPNCERVIPLLSETCKYCKANFGEYSSWKVAPI
jgi:hypothetical protein